MSDPIEKGLVSVVIPVFNEERTLERLVERVERAPFRKEIIAVDDGSRDGSRAILARLGEAGRLRPVYAERNRGKGMACRLGFAAARGEVTVIQDADLEYDPEEIPQVVEPLLAGRADVCYGSRILGRRLGGNREKSSFSFYWGGRVVSLFTSLLYGVRMTDEPTCYKAFRTEKLRTLTLEGEGFELEPEMTAKFLRLRWRYVEVPISYHPRRHSEGKKINWRDGIKALWALLVWRFRPF